MIGVVVVILLAVVINKLAKKDSAPGAATKRTVNHERKPMLIKLSTDETTALHAERDGKMFYFCSDHCLQKFLFSPAGAKPEAGLDVVVDNARTLQATGCRRS